MSVPTLVYFAMGLIVARIMLEGTRVQGYRVMDWMNLVFQIARISALWPLVLFIDKLGIWLKHEPVTSIMEDARLEGSFEENWQTPNAVPVPVTAIAQELA